MSVNSYNPNLTVTVDAIAKAHLLNDHIDVLIGKLLHSKKELNSFIELASTGGMISSLAAPKLWPIQQAAYALRRADATGDEAYEVCRAIEGCTIVHKDFCRLDLPKA